MDVPNYTNVDAVLKDVFSLGKSAAKIAKIGAIPVENDMMKELVLPVVGSLSALFKVDTDIVGCKQQDAFDKYIYNRTTGKPQLLTLAKATSSFVKMMAGCLYGIDVICKMFKSLSAILTVFEIGITVISIIVKCFNDPAFADDVKKTWRFCIFISCIISACMFDHWLVL